MLDCALSISPIERNVERTLIDLAKAEVNIGAALA
jgi:hypothetical protein